MWAIRLTQLAGALAFGLTVVLVVLFLIASRGIALQFFMADYGAFLLLLPVLCTIATYLLRRWVGMFLLERKALSHAVTYAQPRRQPSLVVSRDEAALNRYVAAEGLRQQNRAEEALRLLEESYKPPMRRALQHRLALTRLEVLLDLNRNDDAARALKDLVSKAPARSLSGDMERVQQRLSSQGH